MIEQEGNTITGDVITLHLNERIYEVTGSARAEIIPSTPQAQPTPHPPNEGRSDALSPGVSRASALRRSNHDPY